MNFHQFNNDLIQKVISGIRERGHHFLGADDLRLLLSDTENRSLYVQRLYDFAEACSAVCESNRALTTAMFTPKAKKHVRPGDVIVFCEEMTERELVDA